MLNETRLRRMALAAVLLLPLFLFYGRAIADALIVAVDLLFLWRCAAGREWGWSRQSWVKLAGALWLLQLFASLRMGPLHSELEALSMARVLLFAAALQAWVLADAPARRAIWAVFLALALWTAAQSWEQYLTGHNLMGYTRWPDGALTGPFYKPRAGEIFLYLALPGLLPVVLRWVNGRHWGAGVALLLFTLTTMILIGQRMPNVLFVLGLCITAIMVGRFRLPLAIALTVGLAALAALPVLSPPTFGKLVVHFAHQLADFKVSPYGELYTRASVMIVAQPWTGFGFEGFRDFCARPEYFHGWPALGLPNTDNGGIAGCNLHPHNYYLQVGTMAGLPGLAVFIALVVVWLRRMAGALRPREDAAQAMLFVTLCVVFWPFASTSALFTPDNSGWVFLLVGWGLAASEIKQESTRFFEKKRGKKLL